MTTLLLLFVTPILTTKDPVPVSSQTKTEAVAVAKSPCDCAGETTVEVRSTSAVYVPKDELDFSNICNKPKLGSLKDWYEGWLAEYFLRKPFTNMLVTSTSLVNEVTAHVTLVQKYLADLQAFLGRTDAYALHYMRTKMFGLVASYSRDLGLEYDLKKRTSGDASLVSSAFNEVIQNTAYDTLGVAKVSEVFYEDLKLAYGKPEFTAALPLHASLRGAVDGYLKEIQLINQDLCGVLMNTVSLFAGDERLASTWANLLKSKDKLVEISFFFNQFQYVLGEFKPEQCGNGKLPRSIRGAISLAFIGRDLDTDLKTTFFSARLYEFLLQSTGLKEILEYDSLLLVPRKSYADLNAIRTLSLLKPGFSVEFINEFPSIDVSILFAPTGADVHAVHEANVYFLLYRLYVLLRSEKFQFIKPGMTLMEIYQTIYSWMVSTNYFKLDVMPSTSIEDIKLTDQEFANQKVLELRQSAANQDLILVSEYILYYPPLITLLANKLKIELKTQTKELTKNIEDLPIIYDIPSINFPKDSVHPEVVRLVGDNILKTKLGALSKAIKTMKFDETIKACTKLVRVNGAEVPKLVLTYDCAKPFYEEWIKLFTLYFSKIGDNEDIGPFINIIETSVQSLESKERQDLINFCIIMYFQLISQKDAAQVKSYERRAAERFLMKAITLMTADIGIDNVRGFTTFMVGASDYQVFGKYFKFLDSAESEFHAYNIFYVVLFAQMNEAKRLKLLKKDAEVHSVMSYKAELQKIFEKRYPNVVKLMSDDAKKRPLRFIKSIFKTQFFLNFMDFFDLFYLNFESRTKSNPILQSEFISIHTVFINFYHFLYSLRNLVKGRVEDPHAFVLARLEECMAYAARPSSAPIDKNLEEYCLFSDRKYAEMYYFYKFYLLLTGKMDVPLTNFSPEMLNTHTRMFFIYAINSKRFRQTLETRCAEEATRWNDLCISYVLFRDFHKLILDSTHRGSSFSYIRQFITEKVLPNPDAKSAKHVKFNILFAAEAISLLVDGKGVNYSRFIALFNLDEQYALVHPNQKVVGPDDQKVLSLFRMTSGDAPNRELMIQYLKRTYFKKSRTSNEQAMTLAIASVLDESNGKKEDLLNSFFMFGDHVIVNYVKLFLMYATRDEHYAKIADFLISHSVFFELANLNRPEDDMAYKSMLEKTALNDPNYLAEKKTGKPTSQFPHDVALYRSVLFKSLSKRYKKIMETTATKLMSMAQVDQRQNVQKSADDVDIFTEFMEMGKADIETSVSVEEQHFERVNAQIKTQALDWQNNPSMREIKIWALQKEEEVQPNKASVEGGVSKETWVMNVGDAKAMLIRAESMEDQMIAHEKIDLQNFGFSEKVIIADQVDRMAVKLKIEGGYVDTGMKPNTIMESLIAFGENVETAQEFLGAAKSDMTVLRVEGGVEVVVRQDGDQELIQNDERRRANRARRLRNLALPARRVRI